jgi:hypothetical protein
VTRIRNAADEIRKAGEFLATIYRPFTVRASGSMPVYLSRD